MTPRAALALAGIVLVVAGLSAYRCACRVGPPAPAGDPAAEAAADGPSRGPPALAGASLPRVLDFGRDT